MGQLIEMKWARKYGKIPIGWKAQKIKKHNCLILCHGRDKKHFRKEPRERILAAVLIKLS